MNDSCLHPDGYCIRPFQTNAELHAAEQLQRDVWGCPDLEIVHHLEMKAVIAAGGVVIGAFAPGQNGDTLIGFVYSFIGREQGEFTLHSHMAAVLPAWRDRQVGLRLKLAQRRGALEMGIKKISWTYDPLQSRNAHFNFARLGVVARKYLVDFYGADTAILVPGIGTDRFWAEWNLLDPRVMDKAEQPQHAAACDIPARAIPLVEMTVDGAPELQVENMAALGGTGEPAQSLLIAIPRDIAAVQAGDARLARAWRDATREAFVTALDAGYAVRDFARGAAHGVYLLDRPASS
ncbi:MAG: hypothetical protein ACKV2V_16855 [Blastocatellia bacterium]